jgi:hypothetical protein
MSLDYDWCHKFDFTKEQGGFAFTWPYPGQEGIGVWVDGQGFKTVSNRLGAQRVYVSRTFPETTIVGGKLTYRGTGTAPANTVFIGISNDLSIKQHRYGTAVLNNTKQTLALAAGSSGGDQAALHIFVSTGAAYLVELELYGLNPNPGFFYPYNRTKAAEYAIIRSRENFVGVNEFPSGSGDQTAEVVGSVGGPFTYAPTLLNHTFGFTGSAIFISEALHLGGRLPMVNAIAPAQPCDRLTSDAATGWRVCCESTLSWAYHVGITNFFSSIANGSFLGNVLYNDLVTYMRFGLTQGTSIGGGTWKPEVEVEGKSYLYSLFAPQGLLGSINTGDYVFVDQGFNGAHGFLIVGWGVAQNCPTSLNSSSGSDFTINRQNNGQEVPYVVDFCYGYTGIDNPASPENDKTGWLQDPRPRPFYCSAATIDISDTSSQVSPTDLGVISLADYRDRLRNAFLPFTFKDMNGNEFGINWQFFQMPDAFSLNCNRFYDPFCGS